jgi:hypothetical protein
MLVVVQRHISIDDITITIHINRGVIANYIVLGTSLQFILLLLIPKILVDRWSHFGIEGYLVVHDSMLNVNDLISWISPILKLQVWLLLPSRWICILLDKILLWTLQLFWRVSTSGELLSWFLWLRGEFFEV